MEFLTAMLAFLGAFLLLFLLAVSSAGAVVQIWDLVAKALIWMRRR